MSSLVVPPNASMRDIFDLCTKHKLFSLAQGMIELPPPIKLRQLAASEAMSEDIHTYRKRIGEPVYLRAISRLLNEHYKTPNIPEEAIMATQGVTSGVYAALLLLKQQGKSRVAVLEPFYTYHMKDIQSALGTEPIYIPCGAEMSVDWQAIDKALTQGLDGLILTNPSNPSGKVWSKQDVQLLQRKTQANKCFLICDECYIDMVFTGSLYSPIEDGLSETTMVSRGFSKILGCQSWRVGYVVSHPKTIEKLMTVHDPVYISVPWLQHPLGKYLTEEMDDFVRHKKKCCELIQSNWRLIKPVLEQTLAWEAVEPQGTMYGMFKHKKDSDMAAIADALSLGVGLCPGSMFWNDLPKTGYIRIHCGVSAEKMQQIADLLLRNAKLSAATTPRSRL
eukprot:gb/GEZN01010774.1/.p1 GENE.gb/GEZN01010774.1/~~gb/GEZN01010774.1/.p1  ORF type:complete len:392 (-),score=53.95 gb/GEZN01010774.1/:4-1179(-)